MSGLARDGFFGGAGARGRGCEARAQGVSAEFVGIESDGGGAPLKDLAHRVARESCAQLSVAVDRPEHGPSVVGSVREPAFERAHRAQFLGARNSDLAAGRFGVSFGAADREHDPFFPRPEVAAVERDELAAPERPDEADEQQGGSYEQQRDAYDSFRGCAGRSVTVRPVRTEQRDRQIRANPGTGGRESHVGPVPGVGDHRER